MEENKSIQQKISELEKQFNESLTSSMLERNRIRSSIIRAIDNLKRLMLRNENAKVVVHKLNIIDQIYEDFVGAHDVIHSVLTEEKDLFASYTYKNDVRCMVENIKSEVNTWLTDISYCGNIDNIDPSDSISMSGKNQCTNYYSRSHVSVSSLASQDRLRTTLDKVTLEVEAQTLEEQQAIEREELILKQRKQKLLLDDKLAKATAMEATYTHAAANPNPIIIEHSTPYTRQPENPFVLRKPNTPKVHVPDMQQFPSDTAIANPITPDRLGYVPTVSQTLNTRHTDSQHEHCHASCNSSTSATHKDTDIVVKMLSDNQNQQQSLIETLQLPKTEMFSFDGDPLKYWTFIRTFENTVGSKNVGNDVKLSRLMHYCTGRARKLIQCCFMMEPSEGYHTAMNILKERFGNEYKITEAWVENIKNLSNVSDNSSLLDFADNLRTCQETLRAMDKLSELNNSHNLVQIVQKLPKYLQTRWLREVQSIKTRGRLPTIEDIVKFVTTAADEVNDPVYGKLVGGQQKDRQSRNVSKSWSRQNFNTQTESSKKGNNSASQQRQSQSVMYVAEEICHFCGNSHSLFGCEEWKKLRPADRLRFVQEKHLCVNCLRSDHKTIDCKRKTVCSVPGCGKKHTKFLHLPRHEDRRSGTSHASQTFVSSTPSDALCAITGAGAGKVALPIVPVKVRANGDNSFITTCALLDSGSTQSFCSETLMRKLEVPGKHDTVKLTTLDNKDILIDTHAVSLEISDLDNENIIFLSHVLTRPKLNISEDNFVSESELCRWPHLKDITLPNVDTKEVHLLIGQDNPIVMIPREVRATKTILGWTLNGPLNSDSSDTRGISSHFIETDILTDYDNNLQRQVEKFWKIDDIGGDEVAMSISDKCVIASWEHSLIRVNGHYSMDIPFKHRPPNLPSNKSVAQHRLRLLGKRLSKDILLETKYVKGMKELCDKGYAEKVPLNEIDRDDGFTWYIPHHPVIHPKKPDKVRIVFDCSAQHNGLSLNDVVHQGPDLTNKLIEVLLRFRQEPIAFIADIEGMFLQVMVNKNDRDMLRFLWFSNDDITKSAEVYRMTTHLFGGIWSPSCANFALKRTAQDNVDNFSKDCIETVDKNFYVDDCLKSVATVDKAIFLINELRILLNTGGFKLTKWVSNSPDVLLSIPDSELATGVKTLNLDCENNSVERALGILWHVESDSFLFDIHVKDKPLSRRGLLSVVSSVYDPLGLVSPFVLLAKMLFQELCRRKLTWDEQLPNDIATHWDDWLVSLPVLNDMTLPRCIKPLHFGTVVTAQLHHFSDASEKGYGAVSYIRLENTNGNFHCVLIMSKARLAPIKTTTIPRLELSAAVVAVKLDEVIRKSFQFPLMESVFWCDSTIVLQYLRNSDKRFQTFVANRIAKILDSSSSNQWRYVDSDSNPADDVSRGQKANEIVKNHRWLNGPEFLWHEEAFWPVQPELSNDMLDSDIEVKKTSKVFHVFVDKKSDILEKLISRKSTWYKLKCTTAWILRAKKVFLSKLRKTDYKPAAQLTVSELIEAETGIIKYVQDTSFDHEQLQKGCFRRLSPKKLSNGIFCVGGRLNNSSYSEEIKHPWILPKKHVVVDMIVRHYHILTGHAGVEHVLSEIRQRFWIIKGRSAVKHAIHRCTSCRRLKAPLGTQ